MGIGDYGDKKAIGIKLELCCEVSNNSNVSLKPEASVSKCNKTDYLRQPDGSEDETNTKTDNIIQPDIQPQNENNKMQIKNELVSDSDIEVGLAYRIIDTFNICEVKTFKREGEQILPDTKPLKIDSTQIKVEVDNQLDLDYHMTNKVNVCSSVKTSLRKEHVDYDNQNLTDDVNKHVCHLQSKGML